MFQKIISKHIFLIAFAFFIISAFIGLLIRYNFVVPSAAITYNNFLQAHSHIAFLGWGYLASIGAIITLFVPKDKRVTLVLKTSIISIIIAVFLMVFSFITSGYKVFSISLLTIFGVVSYVVSFALLKQLKNNKTATNLIRFGIYYYLLSSLATWFLAFVIIKFGKTDVYYNTVYFYLHFLYNGFITFSLFGVFFKLIENQNLTCNENNKKKFYVFLNIACLPTYCLSVLWSSQAIYLNIIGFIAAFFQLISLFYLIKIIFQLYRQLNWTFISKLLLQTVIVAYSLKVSIQLISAFPYIVKKSLALKPYFIIGYLHLFTLAFMSVFLMLILIQLHKIFIKSAVAKVGIYLFLISVFVTEFFLFGQGLLLLTKNSPIVNYNFWLFSCSFFLFLGIFLIFIAQFQHQK